MQVLTTAPHPTCIPQMPFLPAIPCECSRSRLVGFVIETRRRRCNKLLFNKTLSPSAVGVDERDGRARLLFRNGTSAASLIDRRSCQTIYMNHTRCPVPISLHPAKTPLQFLAWWTMLVEQDSESGAE